MGNTFDPIESDATRDVRSFSFREFMGAVCVCAPFRILQHLSNVRSERVVIFHPNGSGMGEYLLSSFFLLGRNRIGTETFNK